MAGFPFAAVGAGLGQFAEHYRQQQEAAARNAMLRLTLEKYRREEEERAQTREASGGILDSLLGGTAPIAPIAPSGGMPSGFPGSAPMPQTTMQPGGALTGASAGEDPRLALIRRYEADGRYNVGTGGTDLSNAPLDQFGFPQWSGISTPKGPSHAAGAYQFQPGTWRQYAEPMGINDFSEKSQDAVGAAALRDQGVKPWAPYNPRLAAALARGEGAEPPQMAQAQPPPETPEAVPPAIQKEVDQGVRTVSKATPSGLYGRATIEDLARRVEAARPNASPVVKLKMLEGLHKLLAPDQAADLRVRMLESQQEMRIWMKDQEVAAANERAKKQGWDIIKGEDGKLYRFNKGTGAVEEADPKLAGGTRLGTGGAATASGGREADLKTEIKRLDDEFLAKNPDATKATIDRAHFDNRKTAEAAMSKATTKEARSPSGMHMRKFLEQNPDAGPAEISRAAAGFVRDSSIERNFAGGSGANQMRSLNTVADHLTLMREYATALQTGDIPRANALVQRLAVEFGHPEVTNFDVARDIMADEVVRLLTSTGGTEADRLGMQSRFKAAASPAQMFGALDVAERFVAGRFKGLEQSYARNDPARRREFTNDMLTPEARNMFVKHGSAEGGATAPAGPATAPAAPGVYREGQIIHNPQTGEKMIRRGGQWAPLR